MTSKDEALKMAIEAMGEAYRLDGIVLAKALKACKEALATNEESSVVQPAQEPVAYKYTIEKHGDGYAIYWGRDIYHHGLNLGHLTETNDDTIRKIEKGLNTHPHQWQGLTDDEIRHCLYDLDTQDFLQFARAIEQALKEKNT